MTRWEMGETHPSPAEWARLAAFFAQYAPQAAVALAAAAGVPSPTPPPPAVDTRMIEAAIVRAADKLDVSPRRVRAALRDIATATENAQGTLRDLLAAAEEQSEESEGDGVGREVGSSRARCRGADLGAAFYNRGVADPLAELTPEERAWVVDHEALWRRAIAIAQKHPGMDPSGVYHVLCNLQRPVEERLRRGLGRLRPDGG